MGPDSGKYQFCCGGAAGAPRAPLRGKHGLQGKGPRSSTSCWVTVTHLTNAPGARIHTLRFAFTRPQLVEPTKDKALSQWPLLPAERALLQQSPCPGSS